MWTPRALGAAFAVVALAASMAGGCDGGGSAGSSEVAVAPPPGGAWEALVEVQVAEEVHLLLGQRMHFLKRGLFDLRLPGVGASDRFTDPISVSDLGEPTAPTADGRLDPALGVLGRSWTAGAERAVAPEQLQLWGDLLDRFDHIDDAEFKPVRGHFVGEGRALYRMAARARMRGRAVDGGVLEAEVYVELDWRREGEGALKRPPTWRIERWTTGQATSRHRAAPLLRESLAELLPDPAALADARRSRHEELVESFLDSDVTFEYPFPQWDLVSHDRHPALAVADVDGDGLEDLYVVARQGPNRLYRSGDDGTLEDIAPRLGLDIDGGSSAALFGDFDNDGDLDLFLGRTLTCSMLLVQEGGRFVDRTEELLAEPAPMVVSSVSAADYDGDGLLDLHVATYARKVAMDVDPTLAPSPELREELHQRSNPVHNTYGPANVLLHNEGGGRFRRTTEEAGLLVWRDTYQATWADYDGDGDADLYLANDYAANDLFANLGDGTFSNVTEETGTADVGFGMGASWGDYDGDADLDLYVSNMFSKAGGRITEALPGLDATFHKMARGNTLFRNDGARFAVASGREPPAMEVEATGWSWGGQFVDLTNDGWLDVVVLNGYYSAPTRFARPVDF
jgi:hypothetical protein